MFFNRWTGLQIKYGKELFGSGLRIGRAGPCGQTIWRNYVRDVAVPCGFARPWWKVRLRGAVPLGSAKHAGENAACRW